MLPKSIQAHLKILKDFVFKYPPEMEIRLENLDRCLHKCFFSNVLLSVHLIPPPSVILNDLYSEFERIVENLSENNKAVCNQSREHIS